jgi:hypothetical protein
MTMGALLVLRYPGGRDLPEKQTLQDYCCSFTHSSFGEISAFLLELNSEKCAQVKRVKGWCTQVICVIIIYDLSTAF